MSGLLSLIRLDLALLQRRRFPRYILLAVVATSTLVTWTANVAPGQGYEAVAAATRLLVALLVGLSAVQGAAALASEIATGSMRGVLLRPVHRNLVVLSKAVVIVGSTLAFYALGLSLAILVARARYGFGDIVQYQFVVIEGQVMTELARQLLWLPVVALTTSPLIALAVSSVSDEPATAVMIALILTVGPLLFGLVGGDLPEWLFSERAMDPPIVLGKLAVGITLDQVRVLSPRNTMAAVWQPAAQSASALAFALVAFRRREISS